MKSYITGVLAIGIITLTGACKHKSKEAGNGINEDLIPVKIINVSSMQNRAEISATGLVTTENEAKYAFKIGGIIQSILVEEGQFFKKGQLLATLNITEIGAGLDQAKLNVEKAARDYSRTLNLYKDSVNTLEQLQNSKTSLEVAKKAQDAVAFNARYSKIYATNDGFVAKKIANAGEVIAAGSPVFAINETSRGGEYTMKVGVTDKEWDGIRLGQQAKVTLDGLPGDTIMATVLRKSQAADANDGSFQVELKLTINKNKPAIGMFGKARILAPKTVSSVVIPYEALVEADGKNAFVYSINNAQKVIKVPILIESFDSQQVVVKSGLENTDKIIVSNSAFLNEQSQIKIIK